MSDKSAIEWTDATWNPVRGCDKVSPGCKHCYAEVFAERFRNVAGHPYEKGFDLRLVPDMLLKPLRWKKPRRIFVNSMSDLFHKGVPDAYIVAVCAAMDQANWHTFQVLTKRSERMAEFLNSSIGHVAAKAKHIWWGVSVEDRKHGLARIDHLRSANVTNRFLSIEPLLEHLGTIDLSGIHWGIVGGESGPCARPCSLRWIMSVAEQYEDAGLPLFVKQLGARPFLSSCPDPACAHPDCDAGWLKLKNKKGGDIAEFPRFLQVRQFPEVRA